MANMQIECLNERCSNEVSDGNKWCSIDCKKKFLLDNYADGQTAMWFEEDSRGFRARQKIVLAEIKSSGLGVSQFLESLYEFDYGEQKW